MDGGHRHHRNPGAGPVPGGHDRPSARFSTSGTQTWIRQFGTAGSDPPTGVAIRSSSSSGGAVVVSGYASGTVWGQASAGDMDEFVATFPK